MNYVEPNKNDIMLKGNLRYQKFEVLTKERGGGISYGGKVTLMEGDLHLKFLNVVRSVFAHVLVSNSGNLMAFLIFVKTKLQKKVIQ